MAPSSGCWQNSGMGSPTEFLTLSSSDWPSDASVCSLSAILETGDHLQRYYLSPKACAGILRRAAKRGKELPAQLMQALLAVVAQDGTPALATPSTPMAAPMVVKTPKAETLITHALKGEGFDASEDGTGRGTPIIPILEVGKGTSSRGDGPNGSGIGNDGDPMFTLQAGAQHAIAFGIDSDCFDRSGESAIGDAGHRSGLGIQPELSSVLRAKGPNAVAYNITPSQSNKDYKARPTQRSQAITTDGNRPSARGGDVIDMSGPLDTDQQSIGVLADWAVRRLTPRECERLQGAPDDYTLVTHRGKPMADGPRYKMIGNSWAVPCVRWIGERIDLVSALLERGR